MYTSEELFLKMVERLKSYQGLSFEPTVDNIVKYYRRLNDRIISFNKERPNTFYDDYPFDWVDVFSPIEQIAWDLIKGIGNVVLYPQYPVLNYRADFANPLLKIILECDGKEFHDASKDFIRDTNLLNAGWKVFRISGFEIYKDVPLMMDIDEIDYISESLKEHYLGTGEGVIRALWAIYFSNYHDPEKEEGQLQIETLKKHRLVNFKII